MVKINQAICWLLLMDGLSVFDHFVGLALKGLIFLVLHIMFDLYLYFFVMFRFTFTFDGKFICCKLFLEINKLLTYLYYATSLIILYYRGLTRVYVSLCFLKECILTAYFCFLLLKCPFF